MTPVSRATAGKIKIAKERTPMKNDVKLYITEMLDERMKKLNKFIGSLNDFMQENKQ